MVRDKSKKKVLVVDNHPLILKYMQRLLDKRGDDVLIAEDGLSALKLLNQHHPDVILVDQVMPNITGDKLCRIIRSRPEFKDTCIIMLSAIAAEIDLRFAEFGANYCIAKGPFDKMSTHILALLYQLDAEGRCGQADRVIGKEDLFYRQISEELLYSKNHAEAILDHLAEGIVEVTAQREIIYLNPTAVDIIGIAEVDLLGTRFSDLFEENDRQWITEKLASCQAGAPEDESTFYLYFKQKHIRFEMFRVHGLETQILTIIFNEIPRPSVADLEQPGGDEQHRSPHSNPVSLPEDHLRMVSDAERLLEYIDHEATEDTTIRELAKNLRKSMDRIKDQDPTTF
ncbi:hypothetical protein D3OALGA1CA_1722 [Olavius algarvensis associated proteobacterium Delta 3]|nr:hypothetical protein D3OALGA1CA_1722 [Olavius algarvensis associated proteobacterium Delta 3]CAB5126013.1 hypothetical protein D3OALGB2SA_3292 [Olavius algarvensis associated proteobacterium Delta 3]